MLKISSGTLECDECGKQTDVELEASPVSAHCRLPFGWSQMSIEIAEQVMPKEVEGLARQFKDLTGQGLDAVLAQMPMPMPNFYASVVICEQCTGAVLNGLKGLALRYQEAPFMPTPPPDLKVV